MRSPTLLFSNTGAFWYRELLVKVQLIVIHPPTPTPTKEGILLLSCAATNAVPSRQGCPNNIVLQIVTAL